MAVSGSGAESTPVIAVVGPTATGKSELAVALAQQFRASGTDAEIVNADSMQLYQGMDIGTAKLAVADRGSIIHHLLDVWPIGKSAAVAEYQSLARREIDALRAKATVAILVGGSGLYLRGTLDKLDFPGESAPVRARLTSEATALGAAALHERLATLDPSAAAAILPSNLRRIVRALEVIEITGRPFTATMPAFEYVYPVLQIGLDRTDLDERVEQRVNRMMTAGLLDEVRGLLRRGLRTSPTAGKALGYQQLLNVLDDDGRIVGDLDEALAITVRATRKFVRRQRSWFGRDSRIRWLDGQSPEVTQQAWNLVADFALKASAGPTLKP